MSDQIERVAEEMAKAEGLDWASMPKEPNYLQKVEYSRPIWINRAERAIAALALPNYGPARDMSTAPRDGTRILVLAEVASSKYEDAINGPVIVRWDRNAAGHVGWVLSPGSRCTYLDGEPTGWWPLPTEQR